MIKKTTSDRIVMQGGYALKTTKWMKYLFYEHKVAQLFKAERLCQMEVGQFF